MEASAAAAAHAYETMAAILERASVPQLDCLAVTWSLADAVEAASAGRTSLQVQTAAILAHRVRLRAQGRTVFVVATASVRASALLRILEEAVLPAAYVDGVRRVRALCALLCVMQPSDHDNPLLLRLAEEELYAALLQLTTIEQDRLLAAAAVRERDMRRGACCRVRPSALLGGITPDFFCDVAAACAPHLLAWTTAAPSPWLP